MTLGIQRGAARAMQLLTNSRLKAARACLRLHHLLYNLGYRAVREAAPLRLGTALHEGFEVYWLTLLLDVVDTVQAMSVVTARIEDVFERAKAEAILLGYVTRWREEDRVRYQVLSVEREFRLPLRSPLKGTPSRTWALAGKLDVVVLDRNDNLEKIIEHKSSSEDISPGSEYWRRLRMDGQISTYYVGAQSLGYNVAGCLYDVVGKPALRPSQVPVLDEAGEKIVLHSSGERVRTKDGKRWRQAGDATLGYHVQTREETADEFRNRLLIEIAEHPERYYARGEVVRLEEEQREAAADTWMIANVIRDAQRNGAHPRNPDACTRYGRTCEFFDVCTGGASLDDTTLYRIGPPHPELAGAGTSEEERKP